MVESDEGRSTSLKGRKKVPPFTVLLSFSHESPGYRFRRSVDEVTTRVDTLRCLGTRASRGDIGPLRHVGSSCREQGVNGESSGGRRRLRNWFTNFSWLSLLYKVDLT